MMAEGTPHSVVTSLPKRVTAQMFAEATPVHDPEAYDRGSHARTTRTEPRAGTDSGIEGEAINALVASLQPAPREKEKDADAAVLAMVASLEPTPSESRASASSIEAPRPDGSLRELHEQSMKLDVVSAVLKGWDTPAPAAPVVEEHEEPKRKSAEMASPRVTSRRLEVIKAPIARPAEPQMVAVVVERKSSPLLMPLLIALVLILIAAGAYFVTTLL
jgi:hypothetical protein